MHGTRPSLTLGPNQTQALSAPGSAGAASAAAAESHKQTVQLSGIDSKGKAVPGAFGRAQAGAGAPDGGRKPKRVSHTPECAMHWAESENCTGMALPIF